VLVPLSAATDVAVFASDLATGGGSGFEDGSANSGFAGLAGRLSSSYFTSRGLFLFGAIVEREVESAGRAPEDEGAGEEFPDLASGASLGSSLWLLSCLGGRHGNCLVSPNSTSATSISSWMKDGDLEIFGGGGCGGVVEGAGDGDGRCFGAGPGPPLLPPPSGLSFFRAGAVVEADAGEIGRDEGRWICEPSPAPVLPPLVPPPGTGHSCEERFVEAERAFRGTGTPIISSTALTTMGLFGLEPPPFRCIWCCWPWWWLW